MIQCGKNVFKLSKKGGENGKITLDFDTKIESVTVLDIYSAVFHCFNLFT